MVSSGNILHGGGHFFCGTVFLTYVFRKISSGVDGGISRAGQACTDRGVRTPIGGHSKQGV